MVIKRELKDNMSFDVNRADIANVEENVYNAWVEVDRLTKLVSAEVQEIERVLGIIN